MRLLLLAGAREARQIAFALRRERDLSVTVSLGRPSIRPQGFGWPVRIGGWSSVDDFRTWVKREGVDGILDVTHPFAARISARAVEVSDALGIDYIQFLRPAWVPNERDRWTFLNSEEEAASHIPEDATVFLGTGRRWLHQFQNLSGRRIYCRVRSKPHDPFPFPRGDFLFQTGPFNVSGECQLFEALGIDWLVVRNSGGQGSWPKLEAARELGLKVAMVRRPRQPEGPKATTVAEALAWVRRRV